MSGTEAILANGLRTDHPIPGLPFVDDSILPLENRYAIEALGRDRKGEGLWGRTDAAGEHWKVFTTDPTVPELAWIVRSHPQHGRTVLLVRNADVTGIYSSHDDIEVVNRYGGYWWDGVSWFRPPQAFDWISENFVRHEVAEARTVTARDLIPRGTNLPTKAEPPLSPATLQNAPHSMGDEQWPEALVNTWAASRPTDGLPLECCVVDLHAPELKTEALLGIPEAAQRADIAASTLRSYIARGEDAVPTPQIRASGRALWSEPVIDDWIDSRSRFPESVAERVATTEQGAGSTSLPAGIVRLWESTTSRIASVIGTRGRRRSRSTGDLAQEAAWFAVASPDTLRRIIPVDHLGGVVQRAICDDVERSLHLARVTQRHHQSARQPGVLMIERPTAHMLDWLIQHFPREATSRIQAAVGELEHEHEDDVDRKRLREGILLGLVNGLPQVDPAVREFLIGTIRD